MAHSRARPLGREIFTSDGPQVSRRCIAVWPASPGQGIETLVDRRTHMPSRGLEARDQATFDSFLWSGNYLTRGSA